MPFASSACAIGCAFVGYAGMPDLPALYQMAQAVLFPSLDERLRLPLLEAFARARRWFASDAGAILKSPAMPRCSAPRGDAQALADNLLRVLTDRPLASARSRAGARVPPSNTWSASAEAHREVTSRSSLSKPALPRCRGRRPLRREAR